MELLIPGLLLVAFMVWASTRIKKNAAAAFDAETIETDEFVIQKPEGFLHNLNGDPKFIFEAYSKEYSKANDKLRVGTATITKIAGKKMDEVANGILQDANAADDETQMIGDYRYRIITSNKKENDVETEVSYKLVEKNGSIYKLEITALDDAANGQWVETFFDSFRIK